MILTLKSVSKLRLCFKKQIIHKVRYTRVMRGHCTRCLKKRISGLKYSAKNLPGRWTQRSWKSWPVSAISAAWTSRWVVGWQRTLRARRKGEVGVEHSKPNGPNMEERRSLLHARVRPTMLRNERRRLRQQHDGATWCPMLLRRTQTLSTVNILFDWHEDQGHSFSDSYSSCYQSVNIYNLVVKAP